MSEQKVDDPGLCQRKSRPFSKNVRLKVPCMQDLDDKYSVSTSQIIHDGLEV